MMPKSELEAEQVDAIVKTFKAHMLPSMTLGNIRRLNIPSTFNIKYMYDNGPNPHLNKISTCVLKTMDVKYGGDRYKTFDPHNNEGAPPVETSIVLAFKEIDVMHRQKMVGHGHSQYI